MLLQQSPNLKIYGGGGAGLVCDALATAAHPQVKLGVDWAVLGWVGLGSGRRGGRVRYPSFLSVLRLGYGRDRRTYHTKYLLFLRRIRAFVRT